MGTDIHLAVETYRDGAWRNVSGKWPDDRRYDAFSILADVRNGYGFAGIKTSEGFVPIAAPRGLPTDIDATSLECLSDEHTPSWHTLRHLLEYDWTQTVKKQGWVAAPEWARWSSWDRKRGYGPQSYSGGVSGPSIIHIEPEKMDDLVEMRPSGERRDAWNTLHANTYALATWETPYYRASGWLWADLIPQLLKLAHAIGGAAGGGT